MSNFSFSGPIIVCTDIRRALTVIAEVYYYSCQQKLTLIGVTGTKGKSTTVYALKSIIDEWRRSKNLSPAGIITSVDTFVGGETFESHLTTPETFELFDLLWQAVSNGLSFIVMEVSSQALKMHRTDGLFFKIGVILNYGRDHISPKEHPDEADYLASKLKLFSQCEVAVYSADDAKSAEFAAAAEAAEKAVSVAAAPAPADFVISNVQAATHSTAFELNGTPYKISLPGSFNATNAAFAIIAAKELGITDSLTRPALQNVAVGGRMEVFELANQKIAIIDYAHNITSFIALFEDTKKRYPNHKISIAFGCPGSKGLERREQLGRIADQYADDIFLTEEDPDFDDPHQISLEVASYFASPGRGNHYQIIDDRQAAITTAIEQAAPQTVILITGKGRETRQKRKGQYVPVVSDYQIVKELAGSQPAQK